MYLKLILHFLVFEFKEKYLVLFVSENWSQTLLTCCISIAMLTGFETEKLK